MDIDWEKIKNEYIKTSVSQRKLAKKYGVSLSSINSRSNHEGWYEEKMRFLSDALLSCSGATSVSAERDECAEVEGSAARRGAESDESAGVEGSAARREGAALGGGVESSSVSAELGGASKKSCGKDGELCGVSEESYGGASVGGRESGSVSEELGGAGKKSCGKDGELCGASEESYGGASVGGRESGSVSEELGGASKKSCGKDGELCGVSEESYGGASVGGVESSSVSAELGGASKKSCGKDEKINETGSDSQDGAGALADAGARCREAREGTCGSGLELACAEVNGERGLLCGDDASFSQDCVGFDNSFRKHDGEEAESHIDNNFEINLLAQKLYEKTKSAIDKLDMDELDTGRLRQLVQSVKDLKDITKNEAEEKEISTLESLITGLINI